MYAALLFLYYNFLYIYILSLFSRGVNVSYKSVKHFAGGQSRYDSIRVTMSAANARPVFGEGFIPDLNSRFAATSPEEGVVWQEDYSQIGVLRVTPELAFPNYSVIIRRYAQHALPPVYLLKGIYYFPPFLYYYYFLYFVQQENAVGVTRVERRGTSRTRRRFSFWETDFLSKFLEGVNPYYKLLEGRHTLEEPQIKELLLSGRSQITTVRVARAREVLNDSVGRTKVS